MHNSNIQTWILTEGMAGTENQCLGVAEALSVTPIVKRITLRQPWASLSPYLGFERSWSFDPPLAGPWPDLLLASGRKSIAASRYIKKASGGRTFTVQIQDPRVSPHYFDLVAVPAHDPARGDNVIVTAAAPNRITPQKLEQARLEFPKLGFMRGPRVAILVGGSSKSHMLSAANLQSILGQLDSLDCRFMVSASRRTGEDNIRWLKDFFGKKDAFFWDGSGANPYFAILAYADYILVTADSVSMLSDAVSTGKPVYILPVDGKEGRLSHFIGDLQKNKIARTFQGRLEDWSYPPLQDSRKIADEIIKRFPKAGLKD